MARVDNRKAASHYYQSGDDNSETASEGVSQAAMGKSDMEPRDRAFARMLAMTLLRRLGYMVLSAANEKASGTPFWVSPLMPSAPIPASRLAISSGHECSGWRVPWSHIIIGNRTRTPRR